ncbi:MAG: 4-hydroxy-3-methylbut-2-enyl diphosphate reductase [Verrucomicrobiales bacterium]|jgi:4-hydroxy-3-methylbut-2-enyl diphosphate reductase
MEKVQAEVEDHYRSLIVEKTRARGGVLSVGSTTIRLAKEFGFCYGVERAIDLAYATRKVFEDKNLYLIGEIIHNPDVNRQLRDMGVRNIQGEDRDADIEDLGPDDVVIVPAFGTTTEVMDQINERGCQVIDTTCGDVLSVWKRVLKYAKDEATSIIHGKAYHEETRATASRAMGADGKGHYLVVLDLFQTKYVCDYLQNGGDRDEFLKKFEGAHSDGFDPDLHLKRIGVANQTTMLKSETQRMQQLLREAVLERDNGEEKNFQIFDTICGATQERQDALHEMLERPPDMLLVVGGYNSSNTSQLVKIGGEKTPTFFIRNSSCIKSLSDIVHFDLDSKTETESYTDVLLSEQEVVIGITAGASCPNNLIEETILKVFELRGIDRAAIEAA